MGGDIHKSCLSNQVAEQWPSSSGWLKDEAGRTSRYIIPDLKETEMTKVLW